MEQFITFAGNNGMLSAVWAALVVMIIVTTIKMKMSPIKQISSQELTFLMNREQGVTLDIRAEKDFNTSHIIDAVSLSNEKIAKNGFASLEKHKENPIIVVCAAGISAVKVANDLFKAGFSKVSVLKGGMNAWSSAGLPVVKK
ncbi:MAG: rhodanese-like domain-containing protein [Colwellia sp.]